MTSKKNKQTNKKQTKQQQQQKQGLTIQKQQYFPISFHDFLALFFFFSNYWGGQALQRPHFAHALQIIGAAHAVPADPLPTPW